MTTTETTRDLKQVFTLEEIILIRDALGTERSDLVGYGDRSWRMDERLAKLTKLLLEFKDAAF